MIPKETNRIENNIYVLPINIDTIILNKLLFKCEKNININININLGPA